MMKFNAAAFYRVTTALQHIWTALRERGLDKHQEQSDGSVIIDLIDDPVTLEKLRGHARELQSSLLILGTRQTSKAADRLIRLVSADHFTNPELVSMIEEIDSRLRDELSDVTILTLTAKEQAYFEPPDPLFGKDFALKFPSALSRLGHSQVININKVRSLVPRRRRGGRSHIRPRSVAG